MYLLTKLEKFNIVLLSILFSVNGYTKQGVPCELYSDSEGDITIWVSHTEHFMEEGGCGEDEYENELWCRSDFGVYLKEQCFGWSLRLLYFLMKTFSFHQG